MSLLEVLIKERKDKWLKKLAQHAEDFTAKGACISSGFRNSLADLFIDELEFRCDLYIEHDGKLEKFDEFFKIEKEIMLSNLPPKPKPRMGFNQ